MSDALISTLSLSQRLALAYAPGRSRARTLALLALDVRLGSVVRQKREVVLAQMRLAWWRDMFGKPVAEWPLGDPLLDALREWQGRGTLSTLVDGWEWLLREELDADAIEHFTSARAEGFAGLARELGQGEAADRAAAAGRLWALGDLAANLDDTRERDRVLRLVPAGALAPLPRDLRPVAVLASLARRGLRKGGAPLLDNWKSGLLALRIGILGR